MPAKAQYFDLNPNKKHVTLRFKLVRNLVIINLKINNKGPFNFILDTGVGLMIITDPQLIDSIALPSKRILKIPGLGEGEDCEAYATAPLRVDINGLTSYDVAAAMLKKDLFALSNYAGMPIHGLLGYEFFKQLAVTLNFTDTTLTVCRPNKEKLFRKGYKIPLSIQDKKPYLFCKITFQNGKVMNSKLLVDLGAGHPVSLENMIKKNGLPQKFIEANLGIGLAGPISGFLSRVGELDLGKFKIADPIASFPNDYDSSKISLFTIKRDGSLGIGLLKRFSVIIDYADSVMYLKPNSNYKEPFEHDMSGLEYYATGDKLDHIIISRVEPGSAGDAVGLEKDDEITAINFKPVAQMSLEEIDAMFRSKTDRSLLLEVFHDKKYDHVILTLKRRI